jgi:hypothetical protein
MKQEESIAFSFLSSFCVDEIIYEPNGNRTPDFSIGKKIAVEVRRLSQTISVDGKQSVPEELANSLVPKIEKLFSKFKRLENENGYIAAIRFERPLNPSKKLIELLRSILTKLKEKEDIINIPISINNLEISFFESSVPLEFRFALGIIHDRNTGGFVLSNISDSLSNVIPEKEKKILPFIHEYEKWWLVLIDHIGKGSANNGDIENSKLENSIFEKVFLVSPIPPHSGVEIRNISHSHS